MLKLVKPKHEDGASVCNESLSLNLLSLLGQNMSTVFLFIFNLIKVSCWDLSNHSKKKQLKATEVYLFWIFFFKKNIIKLLVINTGGKL